MKKKIIAMITCLMMCSFFVMSNFTSNAQIGTGSDGLDFYVPYSKPSGDGVGYVSILFDRNGTYYLTTYFWNIQPYQSYDNANVADDGFFALVYFDGTDNSTMHIEINNSSSNMMSVYSLSRYAENTNNLNIMTTDLLGKEEFYSYQRNYLNSGYKIVGVEVGGNAVLSNENLSFSIEPRIHWGADNSSELLSEMLSIMAQNQAMFQTYFPKLNQMNLSLNEIERLLKEMQGNIGSSEQEKLDKFEEDSGVQSDELSSLNQQTQVDKVDVDSVSQQVDSVLEMETDSNYGVLLSTFTSNGRVLTMMLLCVSVALISFVLFGKR